MTGELPRAHTFLLGVGAQKAGTTWLSHYLDQAPNVRRGFTKEYHIWDALTLPTCRGHRIDRSTILARRTWRRRRVLQRWWMQHNQDAYFDYFARLSRSSGKLTYDITPSYSGLSVETLETIRRGFEDRGLHVKVVFLLRDPLERCWSAVRMDIRNYGSGGLSEQELLARLYPTEGVRLRTRYDETILRLEAVFRAEDIHVDAYERLFEPESIERLSRFLGVPVRTDLAETSFNVSRKSVDLDPWLKREIVLHFAEVYDFCFARDPGLRALWHDPDDFRRESHPAGGDPDGLP
jgi:hypothetical protein